MPIKKILVPLCAFLLASILLFGIQPAPSQAEDELDKINKQLADLTDALNKSLAATKPLESQLNNIQKQITDIKNRVAYVEHDVVTKKKEIDSGYKTLAEKYRLVNKAIRDFYIKSYNDNPLLIFLSQTSSSEIMLSEEYQQAKTRQDKAVITNVALSIIDLENKKQELEKEQKWLIATKANLDEQSTKLDTIVKGAKDYQKEVSNQIAALTAQQQQLIAQKLASLNIPRSAGTSARGCSSDLTNGKDPGFSPRIGLFTYGAPHRNGLNQYGAWGRAKANQGVEQILQAYYPNMTLKQDYDQNIQVKTTTGWSGSIEDYVKRIYEVPDSWTENNLAVLKAQAIAARSYALNVTGNGANSICTSEQCQVFKPDPKGGNWEQAVEATKGWVLMDGGNPGFTQYASTHGGYILNLGKFDGDGGNPTNFGELNARAYDRESPWFYCNWGSRSQYSATAWLKPEEIADIFNVIQLAKFSDVDKDHLYQADKPNPVGKETWNADKVKSELKNRGGTVLDNATDISITADFGSGKTTSVSTGGINVSGSEFKDWFNLRAPANIQIVGPLYNVEKQ